MGSSIYTGLQNGEFGGYSAFWGELGIPFTRDYLELHLEVRTVTPATYMLRFTFYKIQACLRNYKCMDHLCSICTINN